MRLHEAQTACHISVGLDLLIHLLKSYFHHLDPLNCYALLQSDDFAAAGVHYFHRQGPCSFASTASRGVVGMEQDWRFVNQRYCNDASAPHTCQIRQVNQRLQTRFTITAAAVTAGIKRPG